MSETVLSTVFVSHCLTPQRTASQRNKRSRAEVAPDQRLPVAPLLVRKNAGFITSESLRRVERANATGVEIDRACWLAVFVSVARYRQHELFVCHVYSALGAGGSGLQCVGFNHAPPDSPPKTHISQSDRGTLHASRTLPSRYPRNISPPCGAVSIGFHSSSMSIRPALSAA